MSIEKPLQNFRSGTDLYVLDTQANTIGNIFLPFNQNQMRQFFEAVKIFVLEKSAKPEQQLVKAP